MIYVILCGSPWRAVPSLHTASAQLKRTAAPHSAQLLRSRRRSCAGAPAGAALALCARGGIRDFWTSQTCDFSINILYFGKLGMVALAFLLGKLLVVWVNGANPKLRKDTSFVPSDGKLKKAWPGHNFLKPAFPLGRRAGPHQHDWLCVFACSQTWVHPGAHRCSISIVCLLLLDNCNQLLYISTISWLFAAPSTKTFL